MAQNRAKNFLKKKLVFFSVPPVPEAIFRDKDHKNNKLSGTENGQNGTEVVPKVAKTVPKIEVYLAQFNKWPYNLRLCRQNSFAWHFSHFRISGKFAFVFGTTSVPLSKFYYIDNQ